MKNYANGPEIPMGLGMALAQNTAAMYRFTSFSKEKQQEIINHTHGIQSKEEMQFYVKSLIDVTDRT